MYCSFTMRKQTYTSHVSIDIRMCVPVLDTWSQLVCHVQLDPGCPVRTCSTVKQTPVLTNSLYWLVKNGIFITYNGILLESPKCSLKTLHNQGFDHCCSTVSSPKLFGLIGNFAEAAKSTPSRRIAKKWIFRSPLKRSYFKIQKKTWK